MEVDGDRYPLDSEHVIRVGPTAKRRPVAGAEGLRLLVIGGIPGKPYLSD
jgi:hypothetical protein